MDGYSYNITLSNGRSITVDSFDPLNADDIRKLKKKYEDEESKESKGGILGNLEHMGWRFIGDGARELSNVIGTAIEDKPINKYLEWTFGPMMPLYKPLIDKIPITDPVRDRTRAQILRESGAEVADERRARAEESAESTGITGFLGDLSGAAGGMVGPIIAGAVTKNPYAAMAAASGTAGVQTYGGKHNEYLQNILPELRKTHPHLDEYSIRNIAHGEVAGHAMVQGLKTAGITAVGGAIASKLGGVGVETLRGAAPAAQHSLKKVVAMSAASEFGEESLDSLAEQVIERHDSYKDVAPEGAEKSWGNIIKQSGYEGLIGLFLGGGLSAAGTSLQRRSEAKEVARQQRVVEEEAIKQRAEILEQNEQAIQDINDHYSLKLSEKVRGFLKMEGREDDAAKVDNFIKTQRSAIEKTERDELTAKTEKEKELKQALDELAKTDWGKVNKLEQKRGEEIASETMAELQAVKEGTKKVHPPEIQGVLDKLGVETVEEAYQLALSKPEAPQGEAAIPSTRRPLREEGLLPREQEAGSFMAEPKPIRWGGPVEVPTPDIEGAGPHPSGIPAGPKEMEADVLSQTGPDAGIPLRTTDQIFGLNVKSTLPRREAVEAQAQTGPEFTGPSAIAGAPPDVLAPDPASKKADLGRMLLGPLPVHGETGPITSPKEASPDIFQGPTTTPLSEAERLRLESQTRGTLLTQEVIEKAKVDTKEREEKRSIRNALKKARVPISRYLKKNKGRMSSLAPDLLLAQLADSSLSLAIKVLSATSSVTKAIDAAWDSLGDRQGAYKRDDFMAVMMPRLLTASNQTVADSTPEQAKNAATSTDNNKVPAALIAKQEERERAITEGIELRDLSGERKLRAIQEWLYNTTIGRQDGTLEYYGLSQLADRMDLKEHQEPVISGKFMSMVFDGEGGYNSARNWIHKWTTIENPQLTKVKGEVDLYRKELYAHEFFTKKKEQGLNVIVPPKPDPSKLSEDARILAERIQKTYSEMGVYARENGVWQLDKNGKAVLGKFALGEEGVEQSMLPEYRLLLRNIDSRSNEKGRLSGEEKARLDTLINELGKTNPKVTDLNSLLEWRDDRNLRATLTAEQTKKLNDSEASKNSQLESTRDDPLPPALVNTSVDGFMNYIMNYSRRMAEIQAFGQSIDPANKGLDLFGAVYDKVSKDKSISETNRDKVLRQIERAKVSTYRLHGEAGTGRKIAAFLEAVASITMLSGLSNALRNGTGALNVFGHAHYAGNLPAAFKVLSHMTLGKLLEPARLQSLVDSGMDASKLKSWGVLKQDMSNLLTYNQGLEGEQSSVIGKALLKAENIMPLTRKVQTGVLSTFGFRAMEEGVRTLSAFVGHTLIHDAIQAEIDGSNPALVAEFKDMAKSFKNVNMKKLMEGDEQQAANFIARFVTKNQGGYTPNQLPYWSTTPMGLFFGKFMPYGLQMNQLHVDELQRRRKLARKQGRKITGNGTTIADIALLSVGYGVGGELFGYLMELLFGKNMNHVPSWKEITSAPADKMLAKFLDRLYNTILYTGTLGAAIEAVEGTMGHFVTSMRRTKDLSEPAPVAVFKNIAEVVQDAVNSKDFSFKMLNDLLTKQVSIYRDAKHMAYKSSEIAGIEWENAIIDGRMKDARRLRSIAGRYAEDRGMDAKTAMQGGRFLPTEMTPYYNKVKDALYLGDVVAAKKAAMEVAEETSDRGRSWANTSSSIRASQPLKVGRFTATEFQKEFRDWANRNLGEEDMKAMLNAQDIYFKTAEKAGLLSSGNRRVVFEMKKMMNKKTPRGRSRSRSVDPLGQRDRLLREAAGF
tara:strand:+ start:1937 stop:7318 length:5382 start_codon:yes stop_codon:yes gene_type:complete